MPKHCTPKFYAGMRRRDQGGAKNPNWKGGLRGRAYLRQIGAVPVFGSPEHRAKMSALAKQRTGAKNSNWRGGLASGRLVRGSEAYRQKTLNTTRAWNWKKLGLSQEFTEADYQKLLTGQNRECATCHGGPNGRGRFHVDHDHETGVVRGLLCHRCNMAIGLMRDSATTVETILHYLKKDR